MKLNNLIDGKIYESKEYIDILSPIDNSLVGKTPALTKEDVDFAMLKARLAHKSWSSLAIKKRSDYIKKIADKIYEIRDDLAKTMVLEIAKPYKDSITEILRTVELIKYSAEDVLHLTTEAYEGGQFDKRSHNKISLVRYTSYGVVLCISPFNYPVNLSMAKIVTALLAGNTVIFKPSTQGSVTALKMINAIKDVLPNGVLNSVTGKGSVIGDYLIEHKEVDFINFTGSTPVGRRIAKLCEMTPLILELGGKDAAIVLEDANLEKTANDIISGAFSYSGQRCTAIKRVLVQESIKDKLTDLLNEKLKALKVGSALEENTVTELIDKSSADYVQGLIVDSINKNRKTDQEFKRVGNLIYPMIFSEVSTEDRLAIEEPFGPILPIITFKSIEDAINIANSSEYGLQSSVFTKDFEKAMYIADKLEVGTVQINNKTQRGPDNFPFLGVKNSGVGIQGIRSSIISMSRIKTIVFNIKG